MICEVGRVHELSPYIILLFCTLGQRDYCVWMLLKFIGTSSDEYSHMLGYVLEQDVTARVMVRNLMVMTSTSWAWMGGATVIDWGVFEYISICQCEEGMNIVCKHVERVCTSNFLWFSWLGSMVVDVKLLPVRYTRGIRHPWVPHCFWVSHIGRRAKEFEVRTDGGVTLPTRDSVLRDGLQTNLISIIYARRIWRDGLRVLARRAWCWLISTALWLALLSSR